MTFKSTSVIKHPVALVWETMRDSLPEIASHIGDIDKIEPIKRKDLRSGKVQIVNTWRAAPALPSFVKQYIKPDMLAWNDYAEWDQKKQECSWVIESHAFKEWVQCKGTTSFEPAIRGTATRITFSGSVELQVPDGVMKLLGGQTSGLAEMVLQRMVPSSFMKVTKALSEYLDSKNGVHPITHKPK